MPKNNLVKTIIDWDHFLLYLAGPIDFTHDGGRNYREVWTDKLVDIGINRTHIINPCKKPLGNVPFNLDDESKIMGGHRRNKDWDQLHEVMGQIVHIDLRFVDLSSLILANFPKRGYDIHTEIINTFMNSYKLVYEKAHNQNGYDHAVGCGLSDMMNCFKKMTRWLAESQIPTFGTIHEIVVARQQSKPVMLVWEGGKETCSAWLMWLVGHNNVFDTIDELIAHLKSISKGEVAYNANDWLLLNLK